MPMSKSVAKYPPDMLKLAGRFEVDHSPWSKVYATKREAERFRFWLYGFKGALRHEMPKVYSAFEATEIVIEPTMQANWKVTVRMPEDNPLFQDLLPASTGGDQSPIVSLPQEEKVDPFQLKREAPRGEKDAMETLLEQQFGALLNSDALHCSLCDPSKQCWTGIGECEHRVD
jgi:hypothetical protein